MIYIDTSVLAAYYCPEPLSRRAQQALHEEDERAISWLVEAELVSALARKVRAREMRRADGHVSSLSFNPIWSKEFAPGSQWRAHILQRHASGSPLSQSRSTPWMPCMWRWPPCRIAPF